MSATILQGLDRAATMLHSCVHKCFKNSLQCCSLHSLTCDNTMHSHHLTAIVTIEHLLRPPSKGCPNRTEAEDDMQSVADTADEEGVEVLVCVRDICAREHANKRRAVI